MPDDYGSSIGAANLGTLTVGGSTNGALEAGLDHDWFRITLVAGQSYIFNLDRGTLGDPFLVLRDQNGVDILGNDDISGANLNSQIRFTATVSGTYYLDAFSSDGADTGTYTVRAAIDPSPPASTDDYGAQAGSPNVGTLAIGGTASGNLETINDRDWFAVTLTAGTSYTFRQNGVTLADPFLRLRDGNGLTIAGAFNDDIGGGNLNSQFNYTAVTTGVYYLEANTADVGQPAGIGTYTVSAVVNGNPPPPPVDDYGSQAGAGNLGSVAVGSTSTGLINYGGDHDWFSVTLSVGSSYRIRQEVGTLADPRFTLRNSIGGVLTGDDDSGGGQNAQVDFTATTSGIYYIDANSGDGTGTGNYTVRVTLLYGAPVIVTNTGSTAAEGAADTITASELSTTDPDSAASAIIYTLTSLATNGTLTRSGTTIALNGTFTQADINSNLIVYNHNGSETTSGSFGFSVTDGTTNFTGRAFNFTVTPVNDAPVLSTASPTLAYTENGAASAIAPAATVTDADSTNFDTGTLTVSYTAGGTVDDRLTILNQGNGAGQIGVAGNVVNFGGVAIGSFTGGTGTTPLVVTFNSAATPAAAQALSRAVAFANVSDNPSTTARSLSFVVTDGDGGTSATGTATVNLTAGNDAPVVAAGAGTAAFTEGANVTSTPVAVAPTGTVSDVDNATLASLTASITANFAAGQDVLAFANTSNATFGNIAASYNAGTGVLSLTSAGATATTAQFQAALQAITYTNSSDTPSTSTRTISFAVNDGAAASVISTRSLTVTAADDLPAAVADTGSTNEASVLTVAAVAGVLTNDTDVDGGPKTVASVNGSGANVGTQITLASGALLTVNADGSYSYNPNGQYNYLVSAATAAATGAVNASATDSFTYTVNGGSAATVTVTINGVDGAGSELRGDGGANTVTGTAGVDMFNLSQGGNDTANGGDSDDSFYFGAAFTAGDTVDGGNGSNDQIGLQGNYTGGNALTLGPNTITNVEVIAVLPGFSYSLTTVDANVGAGQVLSVFAGNLGAGDNFTFNGAAETDGAFRVFGGLGTDLITTGAGDDGIYFGPGKFDPAVDRVDGGAGTNDQFALDGNYTVTLDGTALQNIETIALLGGPVGTPNTFNVTLADSLVGAGQSITVWAMQATTAVTINGAAETNGNLRYYGGQAGDTLTGGAGNDWIWGGLGGDNLTGGAGADTFFYDAVAQSSGSTFDRLINFDDSVDKIDLPFAVTGFAAAQAGTLDNATFSASLEAAFSTLGTNEAGVFTATSGDMSGRIFLVVDADGVAGYQAGSDYLIEMVTPVTPIDQLGLFV